MDRLFVEGASGRRRFFDRLVHGFAGGHAGDLGAYEQAMRERAKLLREGRRDRSWLGALEEAMARHGVAVAAARVEVRARLQVAVEEAIGPFPAADLALAGDVEGWLATMPALAAEDRLRATLAERRPIDADSGTTTLGPHRSDLLVRHRGKDMPAEACSTGEQKALLIAIELAFARLLREVRGAAPLLLLDEIAAHLDRERRTALYDELAALEGQAWLTGTDAALFDAMGDRAQRFTVVDGGIVPA
jgi:DNA replication and repair protein RecF